MRYTFTALGFAALAIASPVPEAAAGPPSFSVRQTSYGGSGCPQGSIKINPTDSGILPIRFGKDFTAKIGPGVPTSESRKNCQVLIEVSHTVGYQFELYSADFTGSFDLEAGVNAQVVSGFYIAGNTAELKSYSLDLPGPMKGDYFKHDDVELTTWSPCGATSTMFNVNTQVRMTSKGSAKGIITVKEGSGEFTNFIKINWRQC